MKKVFIETPENQNKTQDILTPLRKVVVAQLTAPVPPADKAKK